MRKMPERKKVPTLDRYVSMYNDEAVASRHRERSDKCAEERKYHHGWALPRRMMESEFLYGVRTKLCGGEGAQNMQSEQPAMSQPQIRPQAYMALAFSRHPAIITAQTSAAVMGGSGTIKQLGNSKHKVVVPSTEYGVYKVQSTKYKVLVMVNGMVDWRFLVRSASVWKAM
ncbi:hypothetical protein NOR_06959 [Metarhizium rileyi]|uniref:Uncharacterized protein n=1 Tax=Metarhizium rileyi (strain RCEF 4871) TaxID=1649241 RepID=A0A166ZG20_METRR|nr:hypothetical protein NOR_06959 [Metarhizium rileyi RCEF 4871]